MGMMDEMDAMLARPPVDILEAAYDYVKERGRIEDGLYISGDLLALIILDATVQSYRTMWWKPIN